MALKERLWIRRQVKANIDLKCQAPIQLITSSFFLKENSIFKSIAAHIKDNFIQLFKSPMLKRGFSA